MELATHNTMSYRKPKQFWAKLVPFIARCQSVDYKKQQRIIRSAAWYIRCRDVNMHCRFDVVEVLSMPSGSAKINHIVNAFEVN